MGLRLTFRELHAYRRTFFVVFTFCMVASFSFFATRGMKQSSAASTAGFSAGNIMSDAMMANYNSMSKDDIQRFLTAKNPCSWRDYSEYQRLEATYPKLDWYFRDGHFVCLSEERFGDGEVVGTGQTAAEIIYQAAQDYHINPQVLIVLLEKEQGLITDVYPNNYQYRAATGFGCPDTAVCSEKYYGFKNQVRNAAAMFRSVLDGGWSNYPAGKTVFVQYNPSASCGGTNVYIENRATSALYRYTPYQPNASVLNAGYGTGDACGAYGNRNFYLYFTDWFGSTQLEIPIAKYQVIEDGVYTLVSDVTYGTALSTNGTTSGSNVSMNTRTGVETQKWQITYDTGDATYSFINQASGLVLGIDSANIASGANISTFMKSGNCNQKWQAVTNNDGTFSFVSSCSSIVAMDVYGASAVDNTNVQGYSYHGGKAQKWRVVPDAALPDGLYSISPTHESSLTLDVFGGYTTPETNVQVYTNHDSINEKWNLSYDQRDGAYKITNPVSGLALDIFGGGTKNGANVQMYTYHGGCGQKWLIVPNDKGYTITSVCSGLSLDVYGGFKGSGTNVQLWQQNNADNQVWQIKSVDAGIVSGGVYRIVTSVYDNISLNVDGTTSGSNVRVLETSSVDAQRWRITSERDGLYSITEVSSGLSLDVFGAYIHNEANIQAYTSHHGQNQQWKIEQNSDGTYTILSYSSGKPLDIFGGIGNGNNVQQYSWHGGSNQRWRLIKD